MEVIRNVARMRTTIQRLREERIRLGLVPTRGGLHDGHLALVRKTQQVSDSTIVAILSYPSLPASETGETVKPKALTQDVELLVPTGVNIIFAPKMEEFHPETACVEVTLRGLTERLFGAVRPRYYTEVATLLVMLLNIIGPDIVSIGEKDPQLVVVTKRLVRDLHFGCQVIVLPTVREQDGVAATRWLPSMTTAERRATALIYKALERTQVLYGAGERDSANLIKAMQEILEPEPLIRPDTVGVVDQQTLEPLGSIDDKPAVVAVAATIGRAHLIDSIILSDE